MPGKDRKIIVISAVNLVNGGTFTILSDCLAYLNGFIQEHPQYKVIALVHDKKIWTYPDIEFWEFKKIKKSWLKRIKFEYWDCRQLSKTLKPFLWLSLHDITPNVFAARQAVYCHNPTPFAEVRWRDLKFNYKVFLFTLFYRFLYRINIRRNDFVIVQQNWLRESFSSLYGLAKDKIIVANPTTCNEGDCVREDWKYHTPCLFFYPSFPRPFKNFELLCEACRILEKWNVTDFKVCITLDGTDNSYSKWVYTRFKDVKCIDFIGLIDYEKMTQMYDRSDCLVFPSKLETWGLPISEFSIYKKPMLVADLPYAHETAAGSSLTAFFKPDNACQLASAMKKIIEKDYQDLKPIKLNQINAPFVMGWCELFNILLK